MKLKSGMKFGKIAQLEDLNRLDWELAPTPSATAQILTQKEPLSELPLRIGAPVWNNLAWRGSLYAPKTPQKDFLKSYVTQLNCIELNVTHYQIPSAATVLRWRQTASANPDFEFCPKIYKGISHVRNLAQASELTQIFCERLSGLENHLGLFFLQLPPHFSVEKAEILAHFIEKFPKGFPWAIEFRHPSWFLKDVPTAELIFNLMEKKGVSMVQTDVAGRRDVLSLRLTTPILVLRLVGNGLHPTDYVRAQHWIERLKSWKKQGLQKAYFWLHQPDSLREPEFAHFLISKILKDPELRTLNLKVPTLHAKPLLF
jgi:uncharacterized protein YecE (DUF72 family)